MSIEIIFFFDSFVFIINCSNFKSIQAGDLDHLAAAFLLTHSIAHGNNLRKTPGLQYLYYLAQVTNCIKEKASSQGTAI